MISVILSLCYLTFMLTFKADVNQTVFSEFLILYMSLEAQAVFSFFCTGTTHPSLQGDVRHTHFVCIASNTFAEGRLPTL